MYKDPHEEIVPISPAEKAMSDVFFQIRGEAGACWFELDLSRAMAFLEEQQKGDYPRLTFTHILIKACAEVLKIRPEVGWRMSGYRLVKPGSADIGVSVAGRRGGLAPVVVIRSADRMDIGQIMEDLRREAKKARDEEEKQLETLSRLIRWIPFNGLRRWLIKIFFKQRRTIRELVGTFHITNVGPLDIDQAFSPVVMATLMTVGRVRLRPMVKNGEVAAVPSAWISIQGDHRIVDGKRAADFMKELIKVLDEPESLLSPSDSSSPAEKGNWNKPA